MIKDFPTYEEIKECKDYKKWDLYFPTIGGYFRFVINEDGDNNMALDYIENGYLHSIPGHFSKTHSLNKLYKINKKNYNALIKLYRTIIDISYKDICDYINEHIDIAK